jgi:hypothetical protein
LALILASALTLAGGEIAEADESAERPLVVIGTSGLTWEDVSADDTPTIWRELQRGAAAAGLLNRSVRVGSCPAEGWLAVNAGRTIGTVRRTQVSDLQSIDYAACGSLPESADGQVPNWQALTAASRAQGAADQIGSLARWLAQAQVPAQAIGPGAALALADQLGQVAAPYRSADTPNQLHDAVVAALAEGARLVVVDVGVRSNDLTPEELDSRIDAVFQAADSESIAEPGLSPEVLLVSLADWQSPAMGIALAIGPGQSCDPPVGEHTVNGRPHYCGRLIESNATKTKGLALVTDLTAVIEAHFVPAPVGPVDPWTVRDATDQGESIQPRLADMDRHAVAARKWIPLTFGLTVLVGLLGIFGPLIAMTKRQRTASETAPVARGSGVGGARVREYSALTAAAFPAAGLVANVVPWWRSALPPAVWAASALGLAMVAAGLAVTVRRFWRGDQACSPLLAAGVIGLISAAIVALDPFIGRVFSRDAPLSYQTLLAARLYGYPNAVFAILSTGAALACVLIAGGSWAKGRRLATALPIALVGLAVLVLDGWPTLGADFGGAVGIGGGFAIMTLAAADVRLNWKRIGLALGSGLVVGVAVAWLDHRRGSANWTHLGAFVDTVMSGGLVEVLERKGMMWLRLSVGPAAGLTVLVLFCLWLARRGAFDALKTKAWIKAPLRRPLLTGLAAIWLAGSLINDSGLVVAVVGLLLAGPALVAGLVRVNSTPRGDGPADGHESLFV